jgi:hypothetical protein
MLNERLEQEVTSRTQALSEANWNLHRVATERSQTGARLRELQAEAVSRWPVLAVTGPCRPYLRGLWGGASSKRAAGYARPAPYCVASSWFVRYL